MPPAPASRAAASNLAADAMRALSGKVLAAVPPSQRGDAEHWLTNLLVLATADNLPADAQEEVARQALDGTREDPKAERDYEAAPGTRTATAGPLREAAVRAPGERREETEHPGCQPGPAPGPAAPGRKPDAEEAPLAPDAKRVGPGTRNAPRGQAGTATQPRHDRSATVATSQAGSSQPPALRGSQATEDNS